MAPPLHQLPRLQLNNPEGSHYEQQALHFLQQQGLSLLLQNYRCRFGELDLIMFDGPCVVFVEVRYRRSTTFGGALASITWQKQQKLWRSAGCFLQQQPALSQRPCRFDIVAFEGRGPCQWLKNAIQR